MGASSTPSLILLFLGALEHILQDMGLKTARGGAAAAMEALGEVAVPQSN
jgi:hypothetical protein